jgi:hypothetical protein
LLFNLNFGAFSDELTGGAQKLNTSFLLVVRLVFESGEFLAVQGPEKVA